jgi:AcrR family transcriptional regulator
MTKHDAPGKTFHKDTFEKTSEARRQKIFDVAVSAFAAGGYSATKINDIARKAGISIGAMYSYFASKEDLYLTVVNKGFTVLESIISAARTGGDDFFATYEKLLLGSRDFALHYPEYTQIYLT